MTIRPKHVPDGSLEPLEDLTEAIDSQGIPERFGRDFMKTMLSFQGIGTYKGKVVALFEEIDHGGQPMSVFYADYDTIKKYMDARKDQPLDQIDLFQRQAEITTRSVAEIALESISNRQVHTAMARARRLIRIRKSGNTPA